MILFFSGIFLSLPTVRPLEALHNTMWQIIFSFVRYNVLDMPEKFHFKSSACLYLHTTRRKVKFLWKNSVDNSLFLHKGYCGISNVFKSSGTSFKSLCVSKILSLGTLS